jgi:hypothetical protein
VVSGEAELKVERASARAGRGGHAHTSNAFPNPTNSTPTQRQFSEVCPVWSTDLSPVPGPNVAKQPPTARRRTDARQSPGDSRERRSAMIGIIGATRAKDVRHIYCESASSMTAYDAMRWYTRAIPLQRDGMH